jgi:hypothetical protein
MSSFAIALAATVALSAPGLRPAAVAAHDSCPSIDPQFVRFVPPAPSEKGNPLLRLISSETQVQAAAMTPRARQESCLQALRHVDFKR